MKNNLFFRQSAVKVLLAVRKGKYSNQIADISGVTYCHTNHLLKTFMRRKIIKRVTPKNNLIKPYELTRKGKITERSLKSIINILK